jgi:threonylcarbamoyladenosine tRNA methylthiotransferase MtaB
MDKIRIERKRNQSVAFLTLGCKVNSYETNAMEQLFLKAGYDKKEFGEKASVYVINTCTVTNMADRKSRQMIHKAKKRNPEGVIVAVGCYVQAAKDELEIDKSIDVVIGNNQKNQIVQIVDRYINDTSSYSIINDMDQVENYEELTIESAGEKTRAYIKIQDGCNQFCSYCIIPYVRGRIRSRNISEIINEVEKLANNGYQEVVLTGIHLSSYGVDQLENKDFVQAKGKPLLELINTISQVEGIKRIRLGSLEPRVITDEFVKKLSENDKFCPHFHLSLQSGCDDTLKRMNRKYTTKEFYEKCTILREYFQNPAITTDVIVGFPGETEEEFEKTKAFLKKVGFSTMHIFKYSKRKGTKAESMENQVGDFVKNYRSSELLNIASTLKGDYIQKFIGTRQKVLLEESIIIDDVSYQIGHNERYLKLAIPTSQLKGDKINEILQARVEKKLGQDILLAIFDGLY